MKSLDERFVLNSVTDLTLDKIPVSDGSRTQYLQPLESIEIQPHSFPRVNIPLNIKTDEGIYRIVVLSNITPDNQSITLRPNNLNYGNVFYTTSIQLQYQPPYTVTHPGNLYIITYKGNVHHVTPGMYVYANLYEGHDPFVFTTTEPLPHLAARIGVNLSVKPPYFQGYYSIWQVQSDGTLKIIHIGQRWWHGHNHVLVFAHNRKAFLWRVYTSGNKIVSQIPESRCSGNPTIITKVAAKWMIHGCKHAIAQRAASVATQVSHPDHGPTMSEWYVSTYTNRKTIRTYIGSNGGIALATTVWRDGTTRWFQLGTMVPSTANRKFTYFKAYIQRLK